MFSRGFPHAKQMVQAPGFVKELYLAAVPLAAVICLADYIFARLLADHAYNFINLNRVDVTSLAAQVNVYGLRNEYALYEVTSDGVYTVGVWGSNPHAPTIFMSKPLNELVTSCSK